MGPIEYIFLVLWVVFGIVGWIRGFFKELGITVIIFTTLIIIFLLESRLTPILKARFPGMYPELALLAYGGILIFGVLIAYQGQTLTFQGKDAPGLEGDLWGVLIGLFNGWLVVGTLWYYMDRLGYPGGLVTPPLTGLARSLITYLPFNFIPEQYLRNVLVLALVFLILLRVIR